MTYRQELSHKAANANMMGNVYAIAMAFAVAFISPPGLQSTLLTAFLAASAIEYFRYRKAMAAIQALVEAEPDHSRRNNV